jgi:hypothetical protein
VGESFGVGCECRWKNKILKQRRSKKKIDGEKVIIVARAEIEIFSFLYTRTLCFARFSSREFFLSFLPHAGWKG